MIRLPLLTLSALLALLAACAPAPDPEDLSGIWAMQTPAGQEERRIMVLDESGRLHLLGFPDRQGIEWESDGDRLKMTMLSRSSGMEVSETLSYSLLEGRELHISGASPLAGNFAREDESLLRVEGRLELPEDHEFPSGSVLALVVEGVDENGEPHDAMEHQLKRLPDGERSTDYQIYLDPRRLDAPSYQLRAKILVDGAPMYESEEPRSLDREEEHQEFDFELRATGNAEAVTKRGEADDAPRILHGHYFYFADAATFTECGSGERWSVAEGGVGEQLQNTYLDRRQEPGEPVMMSLRGQVRERDVEEGPPLALHAERMLEVLPRGTECVEEEAELENIYWKAASVAGEAVTADQSQQDPHLILDSEEKRARGHLGCNRFQAGYLREEDKLEFSDLAMTRRSCDRGEELERRFSGALEDTRRYRLEGRTLELLDGEEEQLAELEAIYRLP